MESEPEMASNLMQEVEAIQIQPQYSNKWVWMVEPRGEYTTKSAYGLLSQEGQVEDNNDKVVFVDLWKMKVPNKVQHFLWRLVWDRLPTRKNLRRRNVDLENARCPPCLTHTRMRYTFSSTAQRCCLCGGNVYLGYKSNLFFQQIQHIHTIRVREQRERVNIENRKRRN